MHQNQKIAEARIARVLTERIAPAVYSAVAPATLRAWEAPGEPVPFEIAAGQVFFAHMILMDSATGTALCLGRTSLVTASGAEPLNAGDLDLVIK